MVIPSSLFLFDPVLLIASTWRLTCFCESFPLLLEIITFWWLSMVRGISCHSKYHKEPYCVHRLSAAPLSTLYTQRMCTLSHSAVSRNPSSANSQLGQWKTTQDFNKAPRYYNVSYGSLLSRDITTIREQCCSSLNACSVVAIQLADNVQPEVSMDLRNNADCFQCLIEVLRA